MLFYPSWGEDSDFDRTKRGRVISWEKSYCFFLCQIALRISLCGSRAHDLFFFIYQEYKPSNRILIRSVYVNCFQKEIEMDEMKEIELDVSICSSLYKSVKLYTSTCVCGIGGGGGGW